MSPPDHDATTRCLELLRPLVACPTTNPGGDELALCQLLHSELGKLSPETLEIVEVERPQGVGAYVFARFGNPRLLLNAHIDTVPVNDGWQTDPFVATERDGRIYGLGTCDIKGAVAAILAALESVGGRDVAVLFSGDEERGTRCMEHFLRSSLTAGIEAALVCEPTARRACVRHRGVYAYRARYEGHGGHSSRADLLPSPILQMARLAVAIEDALAPLRAQGPEDMKGLCLNLARIPGGVAFNVVPERAALELSVRPAPGFVSADFENLLRSCLARAAPDAVLETVIEHEPYECSRRDYFEALLGDHVEGWTPVDFWTEASLLERAGIPALVVGPGNIEQAHAPNEFVTIDDLRWAVSLFTSVLQSHAR